MNKFIEKITVFTFNFTIVAGFLCWVIIPFKVLNFFGINLSGAFAIIPMILYGAIMYNLNNVYKIEKL